METPTTRQLSNQILDDLAASLAQSIPFLPKAFSRVLAWALAGAVVIVYKYAGFMFLQLFVAHAAFEETTINGKKVRPLVAWGELIGVGKPLAAQRAEHIVAVTVTNQTGDLAAGTTLLRTETRVLYQVVAAVALNAPTVQVRIKAIGDDAGGDGSGSIGNLEPGDIVSFASSPPNVASDATVVSQEITGVDAETGEAYRARVVQRGRRRPQGGAYADYQAWAEEVPGIVHAYPYAGEDGGSGPGQVDIYLEATVASSGSPDGYPTTPQKDAVRANINLNNLDGKATRRPVSAGINTLSITRVEFDVEISGLQPDTVENRQDIEDGLVEHLASREPYIEGLSVLPREDRVTQATVSGLVDTIASANGATITKVRLLRLGNETTAYTLNHGQKSKFGAASYL